MNWIQTYPGETSAHNNLSRHFRVLGRYEMAIAEAKESLRIRPRSYVPVANLMWAYIAVNQRDQAKSVFHEAPSRGVDVLPLRSLRYLVALLEGDKAAVREQVAWAVGKPGAWQEFLVSQSDVDAYRGRFRRARYLAHRVFESSVNDEGVNSWKGLVALSEAEVGNLGRAREAGEALESMPDRDVRVAAAMVMARTGDIPRAQKLANLLEQQFPLDTMMQNYLLPTIRAAVELQRKNPTRAIEVLNIATPYELGTSPSSLGNLYPAYVRGQAYLDAGIPQQAEAEFQKILDHPGIVLDDVTGALAHLQLARAQAMMGDKAAARKAYQDFLTLWKDADPDIPIYKQAKLEYTKLH
jgi:eukaryotic-like serine/threonine-protein kinase